MSEQRTVFNKLWKSNSTELASHKVELGIVDDINKISALSNSFMDKLKTSKVELINSDNAIQESRIQAKKIIDNANNNADKVVVSTRKISSQALDLLPKIGTILEKADKSAKDLGLDSSGITGYKELNKLYFDLESASKEVSNFVFKD